MLFSLESLFELPTLLGPWNFSIWVWISTGSRAQRHRAASFRHATVLFTSGISSCFHVSCPYWRYTRLSDRFLTQFVVGHSACRARKVRQNVPTLSSYDLLLPSIRVLEHIHPSDEDHSETGMFLLRCRDEVSHRPGQAGNLRCWYLLRVN